MFVTLKECLVLRTRPRTLLGVVGDELSLKIQSMDFIIFIMAEHTYPCLFNGNKF